MSTPTIDVTAQVEIPGFLRNSEEAALFAWLSNGRLVILKDGTSLSLSRDDVLALRQFQSRMESTS